jgi:hypothetical protein
MKDKRETPQFRTGGSEELQMAQPGQLCPPFLHNTPLGTLTAYQMRLMVARFTLITRVSCSKDTY